LTGNAWQAVAGECQSASRAAQHGPAVLMFFSTGGRGLWMAANGAGRVTVAAGLLLFAKAG